MEYQPLVQAPISQPSETKPETIDNPTPYLDEVEQEPEETPLSLYYDMKDVNIAAEEMGMLDEARFDSDSRDKFFMIDLYIKTQLEKQGLVKTLGSYKKVLEQLKATSGVTKNHEKAVQMDKMYLEAKKGFNDSPKVDTLKTEIMEVENGQIT